MNFKVSCAFSKVACLDRAVTSTPTVPHARLSTRLKIVPTCGQTIRARMQDVEPLRVCLVQYSGLHTVYFCAAPDRKTTDVDTNDDNFLARITTIGKSNPSAKSINFFSKLPRIVNEDLELNACWFEAIP